MKNTLIKTLAGVVCLLTLATSAFAHHSFRAQYDSEKPVTLKGYVTKIEWFNPHVYFYLDVENPEVYLWAGLLDVENPEVYVHNRNRRTIPVSFLFSVPRRGVTALFD